MDNVIKFRSYKRLDTWRDPEDDRLHTRLFSGKKFLVFPPEYDDYAKRFGRIYRIELSRSGHRWILSVDSHGLDYGGWDQAGRFVQILASTSKGLNGALKRATEILPGEKAFWVSDGYKTEKRPEDKEFDRWYSSL